jgi:DNA polymerase
MMPTEQLRAYVDYLRDLGIYDLYQRAEPSVELPAALREALAAASARLSSAPSAGAARPGVPPRSTLPASSPSPAPAAPVARPAAVRPVPPNVSAVGAPVPTGSDTAFEPEFDLSMPKPLSFDELAPPPAAPLPPAARAAALDAVRAEIGDCTRCPLAYGGRNKIVFADGDPNARLMFVGEGPGADEDAQGLPFVGKAGQLLNNMITAMGLAREQVYIANIVKCRPPSNRTPEYVEATTCSPFLLQQIDIVRPEVIVALGATAATYLLGKKQSLASLRGQWFAARGAKVAVTYHPAFLLRDPRQKGEAWKDLQRVMAALGLTPPPRKAAAE